MGKVLKFPNLFVTFNSGVIPTPDIVWDQDTADRYELVKEVAPGAGVYRFVCAADFGEQELGE